MGKSKHNRNCVPKYVDVVVRMWEMSVGRLRRYWCVLGECVWILSDVILLTMGGGEDCWGHNGPNASFFSMVTRLPLRRRAVIHIRVSGSSAIYLGHIFSGQTISSSIRHAGLFIGTLPRNTSVLVRHNFLLVNWVNIYILCVVACTTFWWLDTCL